MNLSAFAFPAEAAPHLPIPGGMEGRVCLGTSYVTDIAVVKKITPS